MGEKVEIVGLVIEATGGKMATLAVQEIRWSTTLTHKFICDKLSIVKDF
jgi:hypothetical protein